MPKFEESSRSTEITYKVTDAPDLSEGRTWKKNGGRLFRPDHVKIVVTPNKHVGVTVSGPVVRWDGTTGVMRANVYASAGESYGTLDTLPEWVKDLPGYPWTP